MKLREQGKWFVPGIGVKRWLVLITIGIAAISLGTAYITNLIFHFDSLNHLNPFTRFFLSLAAILIGAALIIYSLYRITKVLTGPYRRANRKPLGDMLYTHIQGKKGFRVAVIGGGTGIPSVLRGLKHYTQNITAIVTVADDGGSSGRLRRDYGIIPPGDLRNNIAALADNESLLTKLFQHRFNEGELAGHSFGNLFISALAEVTGSIERALIETEKILNIHGRVLPSSLQDVHLVAQVFFPETGEQVRVEGESKISEAGGQIRHIELMPAEIEAYHECVQAILTADIVVIGPGSLFTSIIPNLLIKEIREALQTTTAHIIYICNIATQPGETDAFTVADHILALENYIGKATLNTIIANDYYPQENAGENTVYVQPVPSHHEVAARYQFIYSDLTDHERPWRHDPVKLSNLIVKK